MKNLLFIAFVTLFSFGTFAQEKNVYGESFEIENKLSFDRAMAALGDKDALNNIQMHGMIEETCEAKGCWMTLKTRGKENLRVTFKDYAFFVPKKGVEGKRVIVKGNLKKVTTDVETLKHYAKDAGKSKDAIAAIIKPREEYSFEATGVIIFEE